jgi:GrpB-like predicted nucleotidyltransferase (UPF0157 family)
MGSLSAEIGRPVVYVLAGPRGATKSAVARVLASRVTHAVHLDGDVLRQDVVSEAGDERSRCRIAAAAADAGVEAGSSVVLEDVVAPRLLGEYRTMIRSRPCHVIVLVPSDQLDHATPRVGIWLDPARLTPEQCVEEILVQTSSARSPIVVADYDEDWPALFKRVATPVRATLADLGATVEHVGSTAVPGLAAKPIIDIDVVVRSANDVPSAIERLRGLGYVYQGDKGIKGREAFMWPRGAAPHHLYVVVKGSRPHAEHVRFWDYLRLHPGAAEEYGLLKKRLAEEYGDDSLAYTEAKTDFVTRVLKE